MTTMRQTFTTTEAALYLQVDPRNLAAIARRHGVEPVRKIRIGRSTVTAWPRYGLGQIAEARHKATPASEASFPVTLTITPKAC
jgi:hypothetical protein